MADLSFDRQEDYAPGVGSHGIGVPDSDEDVAQPRRSFLGRSLAAVAAVPALVMAGSSRGQAAGQHQNGRGQGQGQGQGRGQGQGQGPNFLPDLYPGWNARNFQSIMRHENAHVNFLVNALGAAARPKPNFRNLLQPNIRTFATISQTLENVGVGAYLGAVPLLQQFNSTFLDEAASIALIEARHAGYLNVLLNSPITMGIAGAEQDFERPLTPASVVAAASPFIQDLNGGPPLLPGTPSLPLTTDIEVLNFALALEYLEAEFYNINVPRFFGGGGPQGGTPQPQRPQMRRGNAPVSSSTRARRRR